ncbi:MAG TPA: hypothetical protein VFO19_07920 [Vicinamibacterales bacterium]|nr:hypothetical protein [Vicinamibacterales bacterium]
MSCGRAIVVVAAAMPLLSGCLIRDVSQTWYVAEDGAVTWVVMEKDVRSDATQAAERHAEEQTYYLAVTSETHPVAQGFRAVGAERLRTRVLRSELPFTVVTEGRFPGLDVLGQRLIAASGLTGSSIVVRDGRVWEWTMTMRESQTDVGRDVSEDVQALLTDFERVNVVLVAGQFETGRGFTLSADRRVATLADDGTREADSAGVMVVALRWIASK